MMKTNCYALGYRVFKFYFQFTHSRMLGFSWSTKSWPVVHIRIHVHVYIHTYRNTRTLNHRIHTHIHTYSHTLQIAADVDSTTKYDIRHFQYLRTLVLFFVQSGSSTIIRTVTFFSYKNLTIARIWIKSGRLFAPSRFFNRERKETKERGTRPIEDRKGAEEENGRNYRLNQRIETEMVRSVNGRKLGTFLIGFNDKLVDNS